MKSEEGVASDKTILIRGIGENIPVDDAQLDLVFILSTLDHVNSPEKVRNEILRVLKPGGIVIIFLNNDKSWFKALFKQRAERARKDAMHEHNFFFSPSDIKRLFASGFEIFLQYDLRYLPFKFSTSHDLIGKLYFLCASGADWIGRRLLPGSGGNFWILASKRQ